MKGRGHGLTQLSFKRSSRGTSGARVSSDRGHTKAIAPKPKVPARAKIAPSNAAGRLAESQIRPSRVPTKKLAEQLGYVPPWRRVEEQRGKEYKKCEGDHEWEEEDWEDTGSAKQQALDETKVGLPMHQSECEEGNEPDNDYKWQDSHQAAWMDSSQKSTQSPVRFLPPKPKQRSKLGQVPKAKPKRNMADVHDGAGAEFDPRSGILAPRARILPQKVAIPSRVVESRSEKPVFRRLFDYAHSPATGGPSHESAPPKQKVDQSLVEQTDQSSTTPKPSANVPELIIEGADRAAQVLAQHDSDEDAEDTLPVYISERETMRSKDDRNGEDQEQKLRAGGTVISDANQTDDKLFHGRNSDSPLDDTLDVERPSSALVKSLNVAPGSRRPVAPRPKAAYVKSMVKDATDSLSSGSRSFPVVESRFGEKVLDQLAEEPCINGNAPSESGGVDAQEKLFDASGLNMTHCSSPPPTKGRSESLDASLKPIEEALSPPRGDLSIHGLLERRSPSRQHLTNMPHKKVSPRRSPQVSQRKASPRLSPRRQWSQPSRSRSAKRRSSPEQKSLPQRLALLRQRHEHSPKLGSRIEGQPQPFRHSRAPLPKDSDLEHESDQQDHGFDGGDDDEDAAGSCSGSPSPTRQVTQGSGGAQADDRRRARLSALLASASHGGEKAADDSKEGKQQRKRSRSRRRRARKEMAAKLAHGAFVMPMVHPAAFAAAMHAWAPPHAALWGRKTPAAPPPPPPPPVPPVDMDDL